MVASRSVRHRGGVAAYLATVILDWQKEKEGSVCALRDSLFPSQNPSERQKRVSLKKWCFGRVRSGRAVCSSFLDHMAAGNAAVTRPYPSPPKLTTMGTWYCRRHETLLSLQKKMQNCCRPQEKRRVITHWMEQCQRKQVIYWIGQCQCRSAEYTGSEMLSARVHSHCLEEASPACSAARPASAGCHDSHDCLRQCLSSRCVVSDVLLEGSTSLLPPSPISSPQQ